MAIIGKDMKLLGNSLAQCCMDLHMRHSEFCWHGIVSLKVSDSSDVIS